MRTIVLALLPLGPVVHAQNIAAEDALTAQMKKLDPLLDAAAAKLAQKVPMNATEVRRALELWMTYQEFLPKRVYPRGRPALPDPESWPVKKVALGEFLKLPDVDEALRGDRYDLKQGGPAAAFLKKRIQVLAQIRALTVKALDPLVQRAYWKEDEVLVATLSPGDGFSELERAALGARLKLERNKRALKEALKAFEEHYVTFNVYRMRRQLLVDRGLVAKSLRDDAPESGDGAFGVYVARRVWVTVGGHGIPVGQQAMARYRDMYYVYAGTTAQMNAKKAGLSKINYSWRHEGTPEVIRSRGEVVVHVTGLSQRQMKKYTKEVMDSLERRLFGHDGVGFRGPLDAYRHEMPRPAAEGD